MEFRNDYKQKSLKRDIFMIPKTTLHLEFFSISCMFKVINTDEMGFRFWRVLILDFTDCKIAISNLFFRKDTSGNYVLQ